MNSSLVQTQKPSKTLPLSVRGEQEAIVHVSPTSICSPRGDVTSAKRGPQLREIKRPTKWPALEEERCPPRKSR